MGREQSRPFLLSGLEPISAGRAAVGAHGSYYAICSFKLESVSIVAE